MHSESLFCIQTNPTNASQIVSKLENASDSINKYLGEDIYFNTDPSYISAVKERLAATARFHLSNVGDKPSILLRAPGRLNAFLEYLDMAAGDHMSTTIDGDLPVCISIREDDIVRVFNINPEFIQGEFSISSEIASFMTAPWDGDICDNFEDNWDNRTRVYPYYGYKQGDWLNYIRSSFLRVAWETPEIKLRGVDISFGETTIPMRGGTSSSSSLVVLSFLALFIANVDILPAWDVQYICKLLGEAEWYVGTHGGANDQTTILRNAPNCVLYNRHSQPVLDSTILPSLKGVRMIVANSLWEANKSIGANHVFNLRKGWMDLGDDLTKLIINTLSEKNALGDLESFGGISGILRDELGFIIDSEPKMLSDNPHLWETIKNNFNHFGTLDESILGVPEQAIAELVELLPLEISIDEAAKVLGMDISAIERDYTLPYADEGGYMPRCAARFFHKENLLGRELEKIFIEANMRLNSGEISLSSKEYTAYQKRVGEILTLLQTTLRDDFQVSNPQLELILNIAKAGPGYLGGKLTGAGCGGCVVIMVNEGCEKEMCAYLDENYYSVEDNFDVYREVIAKMDSEHSICLLSNLNNALEDVSSQHRPVTFSAGACVVKI